ncbi:MAG TPA: GumC family protein [Rhizobiaceae bacterium]
MQTATAPDGRQDAAAQETLERYLRIDMPQLLSWLRAGARWIVLGTLAGLLFGAAYATLAKARYTVTTDVLMDPAGLQIGSDDLFRQDQQRDSQLLVVESKRQTLLSRTVLLRVIEALQLQRDPEFVPPTPWTSRLSPGRLSGGAGAAQSPDIVALDSLMRRVDARRDELSFVITMSVWSDDPEKSIRISEAIVKAFKEELVAADSEGARRTADALVSRIAELKGEVNIAEQAVEEFRRRNGLQATQGELVSSRSMTQINQQLNEARERFIEAESRYKELTSNNSTDTAAMQSSTISSLRTQYATLKSRADAESLTYGPRHPRLSQLRTELRVLESEIEAEKGRIVQAARNNLDQAKAVVAALDADAASVSSSVFADNDAQVELRDLTREAAAKTAIYEAFLVRVREITQRQNLDTTNIRVISPPVPPKSRSWPPRTTQLAGFGAVAGMVLSTLAILAQGIWKEIGGTPIRLPVRRPVVVIDARRDEPEASAAEPIQVPPANARKSARGGSLLNLQPSPTRSNSLLAHAGESRPDRLATDLSARA